VALPWLAAPGAWHRARADCDRNQLGRGATLRGPQARAGPHTGGTH